MMGKIWNFEGNGKDYITDANLILKKYTDGLNNSQSYLFADIDISMNDRSEGVFRLFVIDPRRSKFYQNETTLLTIIVKFDGNLKVSINYLSGTQNHSVNIDGLEILLDGVIKSNEMGNLISHLIRTSLFYHKQRNENE